MVALDVICTIFRKYVPKALIFLLPHKICTIRRPQMVRRCDARRGHACPTCVSRRDANLAVQGRGRRPRDAPRSNVGRGRKRKYRARRRDRCQDSLRDQQHDTTSPATEGLTAGGTAGARSGGGAKSEGPSAAAGGLSADSGSSANNVRRVQGEASSRVDRRGEASTKVDGGEEVSTKCDVLGGERRRSTAHVRRSWQTMLPR